jgi:hypothetical protein
MSEYVVVCTDMHMAVGPFPTHAEAITAAITLTELGECSFQPVELSPRAPVMEAPKRETGGYL